MQLEADKYDSLAEQVIEAALMWVVGKIMGFGERVTRGVR
jgi:hypothetical protein